MSEQPKGQETVPACILCGYPIVVNTNGQLDVPVGEVWGYLLMACDSYGDPMFKPFTGVCRACAVKLVRVFRENIGKKLDQPAQTP